MPATAEDTSSGGGAAAPITPETTAPVGTAESGAEVTGTTSSGSKGGSKGFLKKMKSKVAGRSEGSTDFGASGALVRSSLLCVAFVVYLL